MTLYYYFSVCDKLFSDISIDLKQQNPFLRISGIANGRKDFLSNALYDRITFLSEIDYLHEQIDVEFLRSVEEEFNFLVADLIHAERHFSHLSKSDRLKYAQAIIRSIVEDYNTLKFNVVFAASLADFTSSFLLHFCKQKEIPFYYIGFTRIGDYFYLSDRKDSGPINLECNFDNNKALYSTHLEAFNKIKNIITDYKGTKSQPYYVTKSSTLYRSFSIYDVKVFVSSLTDYIKNGNSFHVHSSPFSYPIQRLKKIKNKKNYQKFITKYALTEDKLKTLKYFIYPLHFHPEAATLIQGRWFNNQIEIIEMISKALPADVILIVKEHRVSVGRRSVEYYKKINSNHNVYLISDKTDVYTLINNSLGVVTISSSMGLEAIMLNKMVINFGDIHYNILTDVIKVRDFSKMADYINNAILFEGYDECEYWSFFKTVMDQTWKLSNFSPHNYSPENQLQIGQMIQYAITNIKQI